MASAKSGWVTFSWIMFLLAGMLNTLYALAALGRREYFPAEGVLYDAISSHGWIWFIVGVLQIVIAFTISKRLPFGAIAGITLSVIGATMWFFYMLYIPQSGLVMILLYAAVIYGLAAHLDEFGAA